jgi:hypothetical protein
MSEKAANSARQILDWYPAPGVKTAKRVARAYLDLIAEKESVDAARDGAVAERSAARSEQDIETCPDCGGHGESGNRPNESPCSTCNGQGWVAAARSEHQSDSAAAGERDQIVMDWMQARADWDTDVGEACRTILAVFIRALTQEGGR